MAHRMISSEGVTGFSVDGTEYTNDPNGTAEVHDSHVEHAKVHGYRFATDAEAARFQNINILTPLVVAALTRDQMVEFIKSREKEVPKRISEMRGLVQSIADEEQDKLADQLEKEAAEAADEDEDEADSEDKPTRARLRAKKE